MNIDVSFNELANRDLNLEYTMQTPFNIFTLTSTSTSTSTPTSLEDIFRENNSTRDDDDTDDT